MSKKNQVLKITPDSPYTDLIQYENGRFKTFPRDRFEEIKKQFKALDLNGDYLLDVHEVAKMMEKLGEPKTATQCRKIIAEIDSDGDGRISFTEFIAVLNGPVSNLRKDDAVTSSQELKGRIAKSGLNSHAQFFEQAAAGTRDTTGDNKEKIKADYEEKKKIAELKKAEIERQQRESAEKERAQQESRAKMSARTAMFEKGA